MLANPLELMNVTGKCYNKIGDLLMTCSECIIPRMKTVSYPFLDFNFCLSSVHEWCYTLP